MTIEPPDDVNMEKHQRLELVEEVRRAMYGYWLIQLRSAKERNLPEVLINQCEKNLASYCITSERTNEALASLDAAERFIRENSAFLKRTRT